MVVGKYRILQYRYTYIPIYAPGSWWTITTTAVFRRRPEIGQAKRYMTGAFLVEGYMAWHGSNRRSRLPSNWSYLRRQVLSRDNHRCQHKDEGGWCGEYADEVDHIRPGDCHELWNLRALCSYHHAVKSGQEGAAARNKKRAEIESRFRREERHPSELG